MKLRPTKLLILSVLMLLAFSSQPQKAEAFASNVMGKVISSYTGAPIVGIWVKWSDNVGGYRYAQTDSTGSYYFESISLVDQATQLNTQIDTNLDGVNDDYMMHEVDPVNAPVWDFSCGSDPHSFTGIVPVGTPGTYTTVSGITIDNSKNDEVLTDIIFTPDIPPSPTPAPACANTNATILLVIDHSSSMEDPDPATGLKKIDEAKKAATAFVDNISTKFVGTQIGVVQFAGSYNYPNEASSVSVLAAPSSNFASAKNAIASITSVVKASNDDGTCIECGVLVSNNALTTASKPVVIFLTDGIANDTVTSNGSSTVPTVTAENAAMDRVNDGVTKYNIIYHTIGVGTGASNIDEPFLTQIAAANNGYYYNDPTNGDLTSIYTNLVTTMCSVSAPVPTPIPVYTVKGNVFVDPNGNGIKDASESNYTGTPTVTASRGTVTLSPGGLYTVSKVTAGPLTVSFTSLPSGYSMIYPLNGPPPTFQINVGAGVCNTNGAKGATCQ